MAAQITAEVLHKLLCSEGMCEIGTHVSEPSEFEGRISITIDGDVILSKLADAINEHIDTREP